MTALDDLNLSEADQKLLAQLEVTSQGICDLLQGHRFSYTQAAIGMSLTAIFKENAEEKGRDIALACLKIFVETLEKSIANEIDKPVLH